MEMCFENINFTELTSTEIYSVSGGFNGDQFFTGASIAGGALIAIACAPVDAPFLAMAAGSALLGSASGWYMGEGLAN
jgi:hypothetical protein